MDNWVVDSSVMVKWLVVEADSSEALRVVAETSARLARLYVLDLALVEVTNSIWKKVHRRIMNPSEAQQALANLPRKSLDVLAAVPLLDTAFSIAVQYDVAVYDALFVALARDLKIGGVTADEPLVRAVGQDFPEIVLLKNW